MNNKKAVSAVVATVLIILITISAVTIIWASIIPMIQNRIAGSGDCLDASGQISINPDTTCVNQTGNFVKVGIQRLQGNFQLDSISIKVYGFDGASTAYENNSVSGLSANVEKVLTIGDSTKDDLDPSKVAKINIAPKIKVGTTVTECNMVREVTPVKNCSS